MDTHGGVEGQGGWNECRHSSNVGGMVTRGTKLWERKHLTV